MYTNAKVRNHSHSTNSHQTSYRHRDLQKIVYGEPSQDSTFTRQTNSVLKRNMWVCTGLLFGCFPDLAWGREVLDSALHYLTIEMEHFQKDGKTGSAGVSAGLFSCLDRILFQVIELPANRKWTMEALLLKMLQAVKLGTGSTSSSGSTEGPELSRYDLPRKCLRLIKNHAGLFRAVLGRPNYTTAHVTYETLYNCHAFQAKALDKYAEDALLAVLLQIARVVIDDRSPGKTATKTAQDALGALLATYLETLNSQAGGTRLLRLTVSGLAQVAPAIYQLEKLGMAAAAGAGGGARQRESRGNSIISALLQAALAQDEEQASALVPATFKYGDIYSSALSKTTYFLLAMSGTAAACDITVEARLLQYLHHAVSQVVLGYPTLPYKLRALCRRSLCFLAQGLARRALSPEGQSTAKACLLVDYLDLLVPTLLVKTISREAASTARRALSDAEARGGAQQPEGLQDAELVQRQEEDGGDDEQQQLQEQEQQDQELGSLSVFTGGRVQIEFYLPLWMELLRPLDPDLKISLYENDFDYEKVSPRVLNRLYCEVVTVLRRLDLTYESNVHEAEDVVIPNNLVDQDLLLNLASFIRRLLGWLADGGPEDDNKDGCVASASLLQWLPVLLRECVELSTRFPLVSALYRLIQTVMRTAVKSLAPGQRGSMDLMATLLRDYFLRLEARLLQFSDELLEAALGMLLDAPAAILPLDALVPSLVVAFRSGLQAKKAVETLERRLFDDNDGDKVDDQDTILPLLLPLLDSHLVVGGAAEKVHATLKLSGKGASSGSSSAFSARAAQTASKTGSELYHGILRLLGRLGGSSQYLLCVPQEEVQSSLSWEPTECVVLSLKMPLDAGSELVLPLTIDSLLPRIVELCGPSNQDQALRVTAAESLHAITLLMVGTAQKKQTTAFVPIYNKVFTAVIQLAASSGVSRTLFEKLLLQLVRWFSGEQHVQPAEDKALFDSLFDGLFEEGTGGARETCARALAEYYKWAVKQSSKNQMAGNRWMERLFALTAHPAEAPRMGAAIVLGRIYSYFREETGQVTRYVMQTIYELLRSMRLGGSPVFMAECLRALGHYRSIAAKRLAHSNEHDVETADKASLFATLSSEHRTFPKNLLELVRLLWEGVAHPMKDYRRASQTTFAQLCPFLIMHTKRQHYIPRILDDVTKTRLIVEHLASQSLVASLESGGPSQPRERMCPDCPSFQFADETGGRRLEDWLAQLSATLDAYIWMLGRGFAPLDAVFTSLSKKRGRDEPDGKDGSVMLACIASFTEACVAIIAGSEDKGGKGKAAVALLLPRQRVEERRQEALEKAVWFLATCLRAAAADDDAHKRQRADGASTSGQLKQLLLQARAWAPPLQHLILRQVMGSAYEDVSGGVQSSARSPPAVDSQPSLVHGPPPVLRSQRLPKLAEDLLSHLPLLEPDEADGGGFTQLLTQAFNVALARISTMVAAKDQDAILGVARMLHLLRGLQRRRAPGSSGLMARVWGGDFERLLRQRAHDLVASLMNLGASADPVQIHCAERCIGLGFEMGLPVADFHGEGRSVLSLLVVGFSGTMGPRLAEFLTRYGDQVASHVLDRTRAMENPPYFSTPFVAAFCSSSVGGDDTLLMRLMHRILCVALADPSLPHANMVAAFVPSLALLPWNVVLLLLDLDRKTSGGAGVRCAELLQFVRQRAVQNLTGRDGSLVLEALRVLPLLVAGVVSGCARPVPIFCDDGDFSAQLSDALDRMVTARFTSNTEELAASSAEKFRDFATLFHAYLQAFAACGSPLLLAPLLPSLRQGSRHKMHANICDAFGQIVSDLALTRPPSLAAASTPVLSASAGGAAPMDVVEVAASLSEEEWQLQVMRFFLGGCLSIALDEFDGGPKLTIVERLFLPSLKLCSPASLVRFFCGEPCPVKRGPRSPPASLVRQLFDLLTPPKAALPAEEDANGALAAMSCAFMALQAAVDMVTLPSLKKELSEAFNAGAALAADAAPPALHSTLIKLAYSFSRQVNSPKTLAAGSSQAKRGLQSAALSCLLVTFSKTQSVSSQFDTIVLAPKDGRDVMLSVIGSGAPLNLAVKVTFERRVFGGFECTEMAMQALGLSLLGRKRRTSRRGASSGIMTQFAGTLVEQSSLSQSAYSRPRDALGNDGAMADDRGKDDDDVDDEEDTVLLMQVEASARAVLPLVPGFDDQAVELELKDFNREPVMVALLRTVLRAHVAFGADWSAEQPPPWLVTVMQQLDVQGGDPPERHRVRLFYLRLLMNDPVCSIARRWAQQLLAPVLRAVLEDLCREGYPGFHYFLRDAVFLLSESWAGAYTVRSDVEIDLASQLLSELLARSFDEDSEVMRDSVRAARGLLQDWLSLGAGACPRDEVSLRLRVLEGVALHPVLELLSVAAGETGGRKSSARTEGSRAIKKRQAGLELFRTVLLASSAVLEEQQGPGASSSESADRRRVVQDLLKATVGCVAFPRKEVCEAGGIVCGEVMRILAGAPRPGSIFLVPLAAFRADVDKTVIKKFEGKGGIDSIAACLKAIVPCFPSFLSNQYFKRMTEVLGALNPRAKYELLVALFHANAEDFSQPLPEALISLWPILLHDLSVVVVGRGKQAERVPFVQIYSLRILTKYAAILSCNLLKQLLTGDAALLGLGPVVNERSPLRVREAAYDFLIALCTQNDLLRLSIDHAEARAGENRSEDDACVKLMRTRALSYLLKGITDPDSEGLEELQGALKAKAASDAAAEEREMDRARNAEMSRELEGAVNAGKPLPAGADAFLKDAAASSASSASSFSSGAPPVSKRRGIRRKVLDFFSEHYGLDRDPLLCLGRLMLRLFEPGCSDQWLNYSSYLLLNLCKAHPGYTASIFAEGLVPGQDFKRLSLGSASSRTARMASTPRFSLEVSQPLLAERARLAPHTLSHSQRMASSQLSQLMPQGTQTGDASQRLAGMLRSTQDVNWTQTQAGGLLPGQVRPAESQAFQREFGALSTQAYNEASLNTHDEGYAMMGAQGWDSGDMLPPRFTMSLKQPARKRDQGSSALSLRELNSASQDGRLRSVPAKKAAAPKRVVVYRQYRDGELPDILISHADVLQPLQALCLRDPGMASGFFGIMFQALYCKGKGDAGQRQEFLCKGLLTMLEASADSPSAALVAGLLGSSMLCARGEVAAFRSGNVERGMPLLSALPSGLVTERGLATLNLHASIALLEEKLIALRLEAKGEDKPEGREAQSVWRDLSRLYEALGDRDVMLNLAARMSHDAQTGAALDCELRKDFSGACTIYDELRAVADTAERSMEGAEYNEEDEDMRRLWDARALECKRQLCDWNALVLEANCVGINAARRARRSHGSSRMDTDDDEEDPSSLLALLTGGRSSEAQQRLLRDRVLPYYVQGIVGRCVEVRDPSPVKPNAALTALTDLMTYDSTSNAAATDVRRFLESRHAAEIATAFAVRGDWGRVRSYAVEAHSRFLEAWASLHVCAWTARRGLLQGLSRVAELEDAATAHLQLRTEVEAQNGQESWDAALAHRWRHSQPSPNDPLHVWDALATGRCVALKNSSPALGKEAALSIADLYRRAASATVHQGVQHKQLVLRYVGSVTVLKKSYAGTRLNTAAETCVVLEYNRREIERVMLASDRDPQGGPGVTGVLDRAFSMLDKWTVENPPIGIDEAPSAARMCDYLEMTLRRAEWNAVKYQVSLLPDTKPSERTDTAAAALEAAECFRRAANPTLPDSDGVFEGRRAMALREAAAGGLVRLCEDQLQRAPPSFSGAVDPALATATIEAYLSGLALGSAYCRDHVLQLFHLLGRHPTLALQQRAAERLSALPAWIFLGVSPTLFGRLDKDEGPLVVQVLERVAAVYPHALHYQFRVTQAVLGRRGQALVPRLQELLRSPSVDALVESLELLHNPELRFRDGARKLLDAVNSRAPAQAEKDRLIKLAYEELKSRTWASVQPHVGARVGLHNESFASKVRHSP